MADNSGGNSLLGVIVGALLVLVIGFFVFQGAHGSGTPSPGAKLTINTGK